MADRGRNKGGSSGGIPDTLPLFLVGDGSYCVFPFPEPIDLSIKVMDNPRANAFVQTLKESGYMICVPFLYSQNMPEVGVVGSVGDFEFSDEEGGRTLSFKFKGFYRVFIQINESKSANGIFMLNWSKMTDVPIFSYELESEEFLGQLERFKTLYREFSFSEFFNDGIKTVEGLEFLSIAEELADKADAGTLAQAVDAAMTVLNNFREFFGDFGTISYPILRESRVLTRLNAINELLHFLTEAILIDSLNGADTENEEGLPENYLPPDEHKEEENPPKNESLALVPKDGKLAEEKLFTLPDLSSPPGPVRTDPPLGEWTELDSGRQTHLFEEGMKFFRGRLVNQTSAIEQIMRTLVNIEAGFADPQKPVVLGLFCGPTGVGKTESVKVLSEFLFGDPYGYVHIAGNDLLSEHSFSRLIGGEPGYVGFGLGLKQWRVDRPHLFKTLRQNYKGRPKELKKILAQVRGLEAAMTGYDYRRSSPDVEKAKLEMSKLTGWQPGKHLGLILIDEFEKVHINVQRFLLRVLDDGIIDLTNGETVSLKNSIFVFTANIYGREIADKISGRGKIGIHQTTEETVEDYKKLTDEIYHDTLSAAEKIMLPELLGRIGKEKIRVFHPFSADDVRELIERIRLPVLSAILKESNIELYVSQAAMIFLQREAFDPSNRALGARAVESVIRRRITEEIANLRVLEDGGIKAGDTVLVDVKAKEDDVGSRIVIKKLVKRSS